MDKFPSQTRRKFNTFKKIVVYSALYLFTIIWNDVAAQNHKAELTYTPTLQNNDTQKIEIKGKVNINKITLKSKIELNQESVKTKTSATYKIKNFNTNIEQKTKPESENQYSVWITYNKEFGWSKIELWPQINDNREIILVAKYKEAIANMLLQTKNEINLSTGKLKWKINLSKPLTKYVDAFVELNYKGKPEDISTEGHIGISYRFSNK